MLGVFSGKMVSLPVELVTAGSRMPSLKTRAAELVNRFISRPASAVSIQIGSLGTLAYSHFNESPSRPRSFAAKDDVFCMFVGVLDNLGSMWQLYGLSKGTNEAVLLIEAYKTIRDRAPYPPSFMLGLLTDNFAFILFDGNTSTLLVASDQDGSIRLFWGISAAGYVAFSDDLDLLKGSCGKSLAPFPHGKNSHGDYT